jgi:DNA-binding IclR family transcriptional regulator
MSDAARVLQALRLHPDSTSLELAQAAGMERNDVARRLPELARKRQVVRSRKKRRCRVSGRPAVTWKAALDSTETRELSVGAQPT